MANPIPIPDFLQQRAFDFAVEKLTNVWKKHVRNRVDYTLNCHKKVKKLGNAVDELKEDGKKVHDKAEEDEGLYGREVYHVKAWLRQVDEIISEYGKLKDEHSNHVLINLKKRYLCSKRAEEIKELVMELQKEKLDNISYWQQQQQQQQQWNYMEFKSRRTTMKKIMASLEDSNSRLVGVYGPAGIGKTTLVIKAAKQAQEDKLFDMVIMVNVTKRPDTKKIQGQIAEMLGMKLEDESEEARATSIQERLKNEKDNILIILDDMYAKLDLNALGIPLQTKEESSAIVVHSQNPELEDNKQPGKPATDDDKKMMKAKTSFVDGSSKLKEHNRGYKILLISELRQVLTEMDVKAASIFSINVLNVMEAEKLFKSMVGVGANDSELETLATEIAKKCNGLPMSIVTTARALKNQPNPLVWKDTLVTLEKLAVENPNAAPEYSTKLSYGLLENEELKLTFLLCARMDYDALVADLVRYCIGLGFLQGVYSVWEARDRVQMLLVKLKDSGLLSNSYSSDRFTMQNIVRNTALSISSTERHTFMMTEGKLNKWPGMDELESCNVISLKRCDFIGRFPESIKCPKLSIFHIENNDPSLKISDSFFQEMKELSVLILTGVNLSSLPSSIKCLTKLRMLCLEQCILDEKLEIIGELKNLRILSFSGSDVKSLPRELSHLSNLQIFDISNCYKLRVIPHDVMSNLTRLEELYMRNIPFQSEVDDGKQSENASLSVLGNLNQLTNLDLQIPNASSLPNNFFFDKLYSYKIIIGSSNRGYSDPDFQIPKKYELSRCLAVYQEDGSFDVHSHDAIKMLFERVEILLLEKFNSVQDVFYELNLKGFPSLKHLSIARNHSIQCLINPKKRGYPERIFPKLESLHLYKLKKMDQICCCQSLLKDSFAELKIIKIRLCGRMKNVFLFSMVQQLASLETIDISECYSLEKIVDMETYIEKKPLPKFSKLRSLTLQSLSKFTGFDPIASDGNTISLFHHKIEVPKLERMELSVLQINHIWRDQTWNNKNQSISPFQNLIHLDVNDCWNLECLWSFSIARHLENLQSLSISECKMRYIFPQVQSGETKMNNKKFFEDMNELDLDPDEDLLKPIWLSKESPRKDWFSGLKTLTLYHWNASIAIPSNVLCCLKSLQELKVWECESIESIFEMDDTKSWESSFQLKKLSLEYLPSLKSVWQHDKGEILLGFQNLQQVTIEDCHKLTSVFPTVLARDLKKLEELDVSNCAALQEIVGKDQEEAVEGSQKFVFSRLTRLRLAELPQLRDLNSGRLSLECPELKQLELYPKQQQKYPEDGISKVEKLWLDPSHTWAKKFMNQDGFHHHLNELYLCYNDDGENSTSPFEILADKMLPKLEIVEIKDNNCKTIYIPKEAVERMLHLKELKLESLHELNSISGLEYLLKLRLLKVSSCPKWTTVLVLHSYSNLKELHIFACDGLECLLTSSAAKMLIHLEELRIQWCDSLKEIVGKEEESGTEDIIEFKRLHRITLARLGSLECFYSGNATLQFPSLIRLDIERCPKMKIFSQTEIHVKPLFQVIYSNDEVDRLFLDDLNVAVACQCLQQKDVVFGHHPALKDIWLDKVHIPAEAFSAGFNWESLVVEGCDELFTTAILPSHLLPFLSQLQELEVRGCSSVEAIFEVKDTTADIVIPLKKLTLEKLPNLRHVWNKNSEGKLSLPKLEEVIVDECASIKSVFPESVGKGNIQWLEVKNCAELVEIVAGDDVAKQVSIFSTLSSLKLWNLPKLGSPLLLSHLLPFLHKLEELVIGKCGSSKTIFDVKDAPTNEEDTNMITVIPLKKLTLEHLPTLSHIWNKDPKGSSLSFSCLKEVVVNGCKSLTSLFPASLAMSNMIKIDVKNCEELVEIVTKDEADNKETNKELTMFPKLTSLTLHNLPNLTYIYAGMEILNLPKLRELDISHCKFATDSTAKVVTPHLDRLSTDMEGAMMLDKGLLHLDPQNIKYLSLQNFNDIDESYASPFDLFSKVPPSNIQMLVVADSAFKEIFPSKMPEIIHSQLLVRALELRNLHMLESIGLEHTWVASSNLTWLKVEGCASLKYLFTSSAAKCLVQLEQLHISNCEALESLMLDDDHDVLIFKKLKKLSLSQIPKLESFYKGNSTLNFPSLDEVEVTECNRLEYMFTFSTAKSLQKLYQMVISKCESLETVVLATQKGDKSQEDLTFSDFTYLTLSELPKLESLFTENSSTLNFPSLKDVEVTKCNRLEYMFTFSTAKSLHKLGKMKISKCESLKTVVLAEADEPRELTFSDLWNLSLSESPKLGSFFTGKSTLKFQAYLYIEISQCKIMKTFSHGDVEAPKLWKVEIDGVRCSKDNLNAAVSQQFEKRSTQH
ncbi:uncharacterized protein LOC130957496 isoform X2 [Arachis stenosperma]|uniref:uncharacterized protein LOC130957496 isoform X2 n=1 Tax=Arachis stenosperma TaxID=217475 RepID=UPI0025AB9E54|nr:uncharacterized protein LOC130957496 isoform X2 [Arachis stenosperma]